jgi:hypothetical protein
MKQRNSFDPFRLIKAFILIDCTSIITFLMLKLNFRGGLYDCEASSISHFLQNLLSVRGEVVSLTRWPRFSPGRFLLLNSVRCRFVPRVITRLGRLCLLQNLTPS